MKLAAVPVQRDFLTLGPELIGEGWHPPEPCAGAPGCFRWTMPGVLATARFLGFGFAQVELELELVEPIDPGIVARLGATIDGMPAMVTLGESDQGRQVATIAGPRDTEHATSVLSLETPRGLPQCDIDPSSDSDRLVGIAVRRIAVGPATGRRSQRAPLF